MAPPNATVELHPDAERDRVRRGRGKKKRSGGGGSVSPKAAPPPAPVARRHLAGALCAGACLLAVALRSGVGIVSSRHRSVDTSPSMPVDPAQQLHEKLGHLEALRKQALAEGNQNEAQLLQQRAQNLKALNGDLLRELARRNRKDVTEDALRSRISRLKEKLRHASADDAVRIRRDLQAAMDDLNDMQGSPARPATPPPSAAAVCIPDQQYQACVLESAKGYWRHANKHWYWSANGSQVCGLGAMLAGPAKELLEGKRVLFLGGDVSRRTMYAVADVLGGTKSVRRGTAPGPEGAEAHADDDRVMKEAKVQGGTGAIFDSGIGSRSAVRVTVNHATGKWMEGEPMNATAHCEAPADELEPHPYLSLGGSNFKLAWDPQEGKLLDLKYGGQEVYRGTVVTAITFEVEMAAGKFADIREAAAEGLNDLYKRLMPGSNVPWVNPVCTAKEDCVRDGSWAVLSKATVVPPNAVLVLRIGGPVSQVKVLASAVEKAVHKRTLQLRDGYQLRRKPAVVRVECAHPPACRRTHNVFCPIHRALNAPKRRVTELIHQYTQDVGGALEELALLTPPDRVRHVGAGADIVVVQADRPGGCARRGDDGVQRTLDSIRRMNADPAWPHNGTTWVWLSPTHQNSWHDADRKCWRKLLQTWAPRLLSEGHIAVAPVTDATTIGVREKVLFHTSYASPTFLDNGRTYLAQSVLNAFGLHRRRHRLCSGG
eukprot:TRINITY_DN17093_c0_g1_i1.p1 TRINITY_DN17093_c0_g1~~TRINITY_DN17093_c0_g1_i1.p1  ORF type:complete len:743 (+),score=227.22 TRINITY_DN17093_c0_g1_i1:85-2229(+)